MSSIRNGLACSVLLAGAAVPPATEPSSPFHFVDIGTQAGLTAPTWCGRGDKPHLLESGGTGLAFLDYDTDGDLDLYVVNGWRLEGTTVVERGSNHLYRNRGDGRFDDVTTEAGVGDDNWGTGVAVGDPDGDGDPDIFVSNFGPDVLYLNDGDGTFSVASDAPSIDGWSAGAAFFDADGDGDLDLFVAAYIQATLEEVLHARRTLDWHGMKVMPGPFGMEGAINRFFENVGGGQFRDNTQRAGLEDVGLFYSFGVVALDLDEDLDWDLYVANDSNPNYVYRNDGRGRFQEVGLWSGAALDAEGNSQAGMGVTAADVDGDGRPEVFVTNFAEDASTMYRNVGDFVFEDVSHAWGLHAPTFAPLSWGPALEDFDLDGDLDLFIANGHIYPQADADPDADTHYAQANQIFENRGGRFEDVSGDSGSGLQVRESSRGVAVGDVDGDGDLDIAVANIDAPPTLLRNDSPRHGTWLLVDAPGALRVEVDVGKRRLVRHAIAGGSFLSARDPRFHFGLGLAERADRVRAVWSGGEYREHLDVKTDRLLHLGR